MASTPTAVAEGIVHGGDLDAARRRHPDAPEPWLDLSTGINPVAYTVPAVPAESWTRLPLASELADLIAAAARRYGVEGHDKLVAAPGTQALIQCLPRLLDVTRVAIVGPTYQEHEACWRAGGHSVATVRTLEQARPAGVVVVVNPDNPTGRLVSRADLETLAADLAGRGGLLVVDEAFIDLLPRAASLCPDVPPSTVVLRSFGKIYGLAGLRLGFAIAGQVLAERLCRSLGPWAVSGPALAIGRMALDDAAWLARARNRLQADAGRLDALLAVHGFEPLGGTALFRLVGHDGARSVADRLGRRGILVRTFAHQPSWLRFGVPAADADFARLADALRSDP